MILRLALVALLLPVAALAQPAQLTPAEKAAFVAKVQACWVPPPGANPNLTLRFRLDPDGRPSPGSFSAPGVASRQAFGAATRAVQRCAGAGYDLPKDRYQAWDQIELTFTATGIGEMP